VVEEPLGVEELGEVLGATIREDGDDVGGHGGTTGEFEGRPDVGTRRDAAEDAFFLGHATGSEEGVTVADRESVIDKGRVIAIDLVVLAEAFDLRGTRGRLVGASAEGVGHAGASGVAEDDLDLVAAFLEEAGDASDGAAGASSADKVVNVTAGLLPDLASSAPVVSLDVERVVVLIQTHSVGQLGSQTNGNRLVVLRCSMLSSRRGDDDTGAKGLEGVLLFDAALVGDDKDRLVALERRDHGDSSRGVAGRVLDDRPAWLQATFPLKGLDDVLGDTIFDAARGVDELELDKDAGEGVGVETRELDERSVANGVEETRRAGRGSGVTTLLGDSIRTKRCEGTES